MDHRRAPYRVISDDDAALPRTEYFDDEQEALNRLVYLCRAATRHYEQDRREITVSFRPFPLVPPDDEEGETPRKERATEEQTTWSRDHRLRVDVQGTYLSVYLDDRVVLEGQVHPTSEKTTEDGAAWITTYDEKGRLRHA